MDKTKRTCGGKLIKKTVIKTLVYCEGCDKTVKGSRSQEDSHIYLPSEQCMSTILDC